ncbi:hypothetical protein QOZ80_9AG0677550 [Eleusine coracana subsp. coracana]|nr:hypothetical protein QOZ80_9AG0677550 [Eleusine coracana subsp. coracana]
MMWSSDSDREEAVSPTTATSSCPSSPFDVPPTPPHPRRRRDRARRRAKTSTGVVDEEKEEPAEAEDVWRSLQQQQQRAVWPRRASRPVVVAAGEEQGSSLSRAGSWAAGDGGVVGRARSLTDDDLEELKGCVDLGFGFSYDEIPELCGTLPALELCYSMSQRFMDEHHQGGSKADEAAAPPTTAPASPAQPVAATNWKISSPGDSPDEVKARLKYWAQAVACTVKLCS